MTVTLMLSFLVSILVIMLIASSLWIYLNFQAQQKLISDQQNLIAQGAANTVKNFLQERFSLLKATVRFSNLTTALKETQNLALTRLMGLEPSFRQLVLLNTQGRELLRVSRLSQGASKRLIDQLQSNAIIQIKEDRDYIGPIYIDEITSEPIVIMAVPVTSTLRDFQGILVAEVNLKFMWDLVGGIKIGKKGLAYVVDRQGNLIAFVDISRVLAGENLSHLKEVNEFITMDIPPHRYHAEISKGIQGTYVVMTHVRLGAPDWAVVVELPVFEAYKTVMSGIGYAAGAFILSVILALVLGVYLSKRITKPIINLRDAALRIGGGELDIKIEIKTNDEIGDLAKAFTLMTQDLQRTTTSIDNLNKEISERKKIEEALRRAEERYRMQFEEALDGIFVSDAETGILIDCNPAAAKLVGRERSEIIGQHQRILHPREETEEEFSKTYVQHLKEKQGQVLETQVITKTGEIREVAITASMWEVGGKKVMQGIFRDITERKKAEEELKNAYEQLKQTQAQLVQSAKMASVGLLAGGVAHEINNPLTGVLNNVQLIKMIAEQKKEFNLEDFKELLNLIEESAQRCTKITHSLLGFSRASKGIFQNLSLNEMIEKVVVLVEHELKLQNITIQTDLAPHLPQIKGDSQLLQQIIFDIINNAKWSIQQKSEKENSTITIRTKAGSQNNSISLSISDTGMGIPKGNLERIFDPFFTTKPVGEGTGLGLAVVYNIVKEHNGTITVESEVGKGATFKISLPAF